MRRLLIRWTAIVLAIPGALGLLGTVVVFILWATGTYAATQGVAGVDDGSAAILGVTLGVMGLVIVAGCFLYSMSLFFFSCLLWGMELLIERAEKRDRLLNEQITAIYKLQKLLGPPA